MEAKTQTPPPPPPPPLSLSVSLSLSLSLYVYLTTAEIWWYNSDTTTGQYANNSWYFRFDEA